MKLTITALLLSPAIVESMGQSQGRSFPEVSELPAKAGLPEALVMFDGRRVATPEQWTKERRPELRALFQHYMYGFIPPAPDRVDSRVRRVDSKAFDGKATLKEVSLKVGPPGAPEIELLLVVPNRRERPAPCVLGLNFYGNHAVLADPQIALPKGWMPGRAPGVKDNRATDAGRGTQVEAWSIERAIDRGYAVATFYHGDVFPDKNDFSEGVWKYYMKEGKTARGPDDWSCIGIWAWGLQRCMDYLVTDSEVDKSRVAVFGHSRNGKTALVAAAFDDRFALVLPHQAGCGGTAPSRGTVGESVKKINDSFPHWFCDEFKKFNDQVDRLPIDQHELLALVAPRPVLYSNAVEDQWANPGGQFEMLQAADRVYRFLGAGGLEAEKMPETGKLVDSTLGYYIRPGKHSTTPEDWKVFLDFCDRHLKAR